MKKVDILEYEYIGITTRSIFVSVVRATQVTARRKIANSHTPLHEHVVQHVGNNVVQQLKSRDNSVRYNWMVFIIVVQHVRAVEYDYN